MKTFDLDKWKKKYNSLVSIKIEITPPSGFFDVFLYKNPKKSASGLLETTTDTSVLIEETIYAYLHMLCDDKSLQPEFSPVIRTVKSNNKVIIIVFQFDKKYIIPIQEFSDKIAKIYESKCLVQKINFKKHYGTVMSIGQFAK